MPGLDAPTFGVHSPPGIRRHSMCHKDGEVEIEHLLLSLLPRPLYPKSNAVRFNPIEKARNSRSTQQCRLYRLGKTDQRGPDGYSLGIAPSDVREQEIVCHISHSVRAFFVRVLKTQRTSYWDCHGCSRLASSRKQKPPSRTLGYHARS